MLDGTIVASCRLLALSDDEVSVVAHELCDPLRPLLAVNLSSTAKGLRAAMQPSLAELRLQRQAAEAFAVHIGWSIAWLRYTTGLSLGQVFSMPITLAHWRTLGHLIGCRSLPRLEGLHILGADNGDEGVALLTAGLRRGGLPSLRALELMNTQIGEQGAAALATALTNRTLPALMRLNLGGNQIGDAGMAALAPALRQLPRLKLLALNGNQIGDRCLASLLAEPMQGVLPSLCELYLDDNLITDSGLTALASALRNELLPALETLSVQGNSASQEAHDSVKALVSARRNARYALRHFTSTVQHTRHYSEALQRRRGSRRWPCYN